MLKPIVSFELEKCCLAGLLHYPEIYGEVATWLSENDFVGNSAHPIIYSIIKKRLEQAQTASPLLIAEEIDRLGIKFPEIENIKSYIIEGLGLITINKTGLLDSIKELKKITVAREIDKTAQDISQTVRKSLHLPIDEIIDNCDSKYNNRVETFFGKSEVNNIFGDALVEKLEERRKNPTDNTGLLGPYNKINELYGSLVRPGNITTICARSGSYKTTMLVHYGASLSDMHDIGIIHMDMGEMSESELEDRQVAAMSGVPLHYIETGKFGLNEELLQKVRNTYPKIRKLRYYYIPVGNKNANQIISQLRRTYYSKIGRGNPTALILDYWKSYGSDYNTQKAEWERFGKFTQDFKNCITQEIPIGMCAGLQSNRVGIVTGKNANEVADDEGIASGGDRIIFHSSHFFILRLKTLDVVSNEHNKYGNCLIKNVAKCRHLGINIKDAITPVKMPDGSYQKNYIHLNIENFNVQEIGDLKTTVDQLNQLDIKNKHQDGDLHL